MCTSWFLLSNWYTVQSPTNILLNRLNELEDFLDSTGGAYPLHKDFPMLKSMNWIYEPYRLLRSSGRLYSKSVEEYESVIYDVSYRIQQFLEGNGREKPLALEYKIIDQIGNIFIVEEIGCNARVAMYSDGIRSFVSIKSNANNVVIGKMSPYVPFNIKELYDVLNKIENITNPNNGWGGSDIIGGSPRVGGTSLSNEELIKIVKEFCKK